MKRNAPVKSVLMIVVAIGILVVTSIGQDSPQPPAGYTLTAAEKELFESIGKAKATMAFCGFVPDNADCKKGDSKETYRKLMSDAAERPNVLLALAVESMQRFDSFGLQSKSAPQATQIATELNADLTRVIIIQNQRIIELLEQLVKKKP